MSISSAFQIRGRSITLQASAAAQSAQIFLTDLLIDNFPSQWRLVNNGTVDIWMDFVDAATTAAFPTFGTTTAGSPQFGFRLKPGIIEVFGVVIRKTLATPALPPQFFVNYISTSPAQQFDLTPGEGL